MIGGESAVAVNKMAGQAAMRLSRRCRTHLLEWEDVRQELLIDLWSRREAFDPLRGSPGPFVSMCFRHRSARLAKTVRREMQARHPVSLDEPASSSSTESLGETLTETDGYTAWIGQPADAFARVEQRLDLDRALSALSDDALLICAALMEGVDNPAAAAGVPRTTMHRRLQELRYKLLVAGIAEPVEHSAHPVST